MGDSEQERLARVETSLNTLLDEVRMLRHDMQDVSDRLTKVEAIVAGTAPEVWPLRERVAQLERETAAIKAEQERMRREYEQARSSWGARAWDLAKIVLGPIISGLLAAWWVMRR